MAHYPINSSEEVINPQSQARKEDESLKSSEKDQSGKSTFWNHIKNEKTLKNVTVAIMINLSQLGSLESVLDNVNDISLIRNAGSDKNKYVSIFLYRFVAFFPK